LLALPDTPLQNVDRDRREKETKSPPRRGAPTSTDKLAHISWVIYYNIYIESYYFINVNKIYFKKSYLMLKTFSSISG